jgi:hypothetical protein
MKLKIFYLLVFLSVAVLIALTPVLPGISIGLNADRLAVQTHSKIIGTIKNNKVVEGCGCSLQVPSKSQKYSQDSVFLADFSQHAWMNIDGKDVKLTQVKTTEPKGALKKGARFQEVYLAPHTKVQIDYVVSSVCKPQDQECEFTGYDANIKVTRDRRQQIVKTVGGCGC